MLGRARRHHGAFRRDRRDPASRDNADRGRNVAGDRQLDQRRGNQHPTRRPARGHPHEWSAATNGSQSAAALEIASGTSVMAVGGWSGDPVPTLQQFVDDVHAGKISYYVEAGRGPNSPAVRGEVIRSEVTARRTPARSPTGSRHIIPALSSADRRCTACSDRLPCGCVQLAGLRRRSRRSADPRSRRFRRRRDRRWPAPSRRPHAAATVDRRLVGRRRHRAAHRDRVAAGCHDDAHNARSRVATLRVAR